MVFIQWFWLTRPNTKPLQQFLELFVLVRKIIRKENLRNMYFDSSSDILFERDYVTSFEERLKKWLHRQLSSFNNVLMFACFLVLPVCAPRKRAKTVTACLVFNFTASAGAKRTAQRRTPCLVQRKTQVVSWIILIQTTKSVA